MKVQLNASGNQLSSWSQNQVSACQFYGVSCEGNNVVSVYDPLHLIAFSRNSIYNSRSYSHYQVCPKRHHNKPSTSKGDRSTPPFFATYHYTNELKIKHILVPLIIHRLKGYAMNVLEGCLGET